MISLNPKNGKPRVLMFSQRNIIPNALWRCPLYEFEDTICQVDAVEVLAPVPGKLFGYGNRLANRVAASSTVALNPGIPKTEIKDDYDMLFTICSFPKDLLNFRIERWKEHCRISVCLVDEIWIKELFRQKCYLKLMSQFDYVMLYYSQSVKPVSEITGNRCHFLPPGVDAIRFCPYPDPPNRVIDVYSIGRRSERTHQALLEMAKGKEIFYVHDTISGNQAIRSGEHREMLANMAKRSRYYIVNPGLIDAPEVRGDQIEIGNRYFEGAAAGNIMIGEIPRNESYEKLFHWRDAVIDLPFGSSEIGRVLHELDGQPARQETIRRENMVHALKQHDWVYRWETVLKIVGMDPLPALSERKRRLGDLSETIEQEGNNS
jgi:Glycosyl transferases group 1